jgi:hypothetical protein
VGLTNISGAGHHYQAVRSDTQPGSGRGQPGPWIRVMNSPYFPQTPKAAFCLGLSALGMFATRTTVAHVQQLFQNPNLDWNYVLGQLGLAAVATGTALVQFHNENSRAIKERNKAQNAHELSSASTVSPTEAENRV